MMDVRNWLRWLLACGLGIGLLGSWAVWQDDGEQASVTVCDVYSETSDTPVADEVYEQQEAARLRQASRERAQLQLQWAEDQADQQIEAMLVRLNALFDDARLATPELADDLLGFSSKWRLAMDYVPFTRGDRHQEYLRKRFAARLFSPLQLQQAIEAVVRDYVRATADIEDQMLVRLRLDLENLLSSAPSGAMDEERLHALFEPILGVLREQVGVGLASDLTSLAASELATQIAFRILSRAAIRLGVSSGILGASAASAWGTLGTSLIVGLIVDWIVAKIWDWWSDPRGELTAKLNEELAALQERLVEGDEDTAGLRAALRGWGRQRATVRRQAVLPVFEDR